MSKYHEDMDILHSSKCMYTFLQYFLLTWIHYVLFVAMLFYYWAWVYPRQEDIVYLGYCLVWLAGSFQTLVRKIPLLYHPTFVIEKYQNGIHLFWPLAYLRPSHIREHLLTIKLTTLRVLVWKHISILHATWLSEFLNKWELQSLFWPLLPQMKKCLKTRWI